MANLRSLAVLRRKSRKRRIASLEISARLGARVAFAKCRLCGVDLPLGLHASTRYHDDCKAVIRRQQKRSCWHRNRDVYTANKEKAAKLKKVS